MTADARRSPRSWEDGEIPVRLAFDLCVGQRPAGSKTSVADDGGTIDAVSTAATGGKTMVVLGKCWVVEGESAGDSKVFPARRLSRLDSMTRVLRAWVPSGFASGVCV